MSNHSSTLGSFVPLGQERDRQATQIPDVYRPQSLSFARSIVYHDPNDEDPESEQAFLGSLRGQFNELRHIHVPDGIPNPMIGNDGGAIRNFLHEAMDPNNQVQLAPPPADTVPEWFTSALQQETWIPEPQPDCSAAFKSLQNLQAIGELGNAVNELKHLSTIARAKLFMKLMTYYTSTQDLKVIQALFLCGELQPLVVNLLLGNDIGCAKEEKTVHSTCSVCQEDFSEGDKVVRLNCEHIFHTNCISNWLYRYRHTSCPMCKATVDVPKKPPTAATAADDTNAAANETPSPLSSSQVGPQSPAPYRQRMDTLLPIPADGRSADGRQLDTFDELSEDTSIGYWGAR